MHNFHYVSRKQLSPVKNDVIQIINAVQSLMRKDFTFQYYFIGSSERNLVTYDADINIGYDFDVNFQVNSTSNDFAPKEIKMRIKNALDKVAIHFGYDYAEDSTRVLTIKIKDKKNSRIVHSCDFAIVNDYIDNEGNERQEYIHFNKKKNVYTWEERQKGYYLLDEKVDWIRNNGYWQEVRTLYLDKKNHNNDQHKHSRSIYAETIHQICQKYGYYD